MDPPPARHLVELAGRDLRVQAQMVTEPVLVRAVLEVLQDLFAARVPARPVVLRLERERVEVRGDVAGEAGVGVVAPHAPDPARPLKDRERVDARLPERYSHADAAHAGADDRTVCG